MSYSKSPITLRRIQREYNPLLAGMDCIWQRPPNLDARRWANRWAYKLREGLIVAKANPDEFPELAAIADNVRVLVTSPDMVEMKFERTAARAAVDILPKAKPHLAPQVAEDSVTLQDVTDYFDQAQARGDASKVHFASTTVDEYEVEILAEHIGRSGWMLLRARDGALTLAPDDPDVPEEAKVPSLARERFTRERGSAV